MARCPRCGQGINSTYIRIGEKSLLKKIGFYCISCDTVYDFNQKPYTKNEILCTVEGRWSSLVKIPPQTWRKSDENRTPPNTDENEIINKRAEMGRVGFEPTTPAMSRLLSIENNTNDLLGLYKSLRY